jgi:hypothetical protein
VAKLVPTVKTTYTSSELVKGFIDGWQTAFNETPSKQSIGVLYAQNGIETGGSGAMWNNNIGNVKLANMSEDVEYFALSHTWEILNGVRRVFEPPSPYCNFRSFPTLAAGMAFQLDFLKNHRYAKAWGAVLAGSCDQFAQILHNLRYYTAPPSDYARGMNSYFAKYIKSNAYDQIIAGETNIPNIVIENPEGIDFNLGLNIGIDDDQQADAGIDPNDAQS